MGHGRVVRQRESARLRKRDRLSTSFAATFPDGTGGLVPHLQVPPLDTLGRRLQHIGWLASQYLGHRFDLLGSGWVEVRHGMACLGLEGIRFPADRFAGPESRDLISIANRSESERIRSLIGPDYEPIDWQLDFKTGFRWSESTWYRDIRYGDIRGADVKVPWELGRLQHLPQLAIAATLARSDGDGVLAEQLARQFQDQVLDFVAANPPRFGVQWAMTMDVAIRAANLLLAWDIFRAAGVSFDIEFMREFSRSAFEHGSHIATNLEWSSHLRSNHYLADVVGLLFVAAYLPASTLTDAWLLFATRELLAEVQNQFLADGGNFEGSTCYHRLSAEMATWVSPSCWPCRRIVCQPCSSHPRRCWRRDAAYLERLWVRCQRMFLVTDAGRRSGPTSSIGSPEHEPSR